MDYQYNQEQYNQRPMRNPNRSLWMENASVILGVIALVSIPIIYPTIICGALSIMFAFMSKGGERSITARARLGLILSFIAFAAAVCLVLYSVYILSAAYGSIFNLPVNPSGDIDMLSLFDGLNAYMNSL